MAISRPVGGGGGLNRVCCVRGFRRGRSAAGRRAPAGSRGARGSGPLAAGEGPAPSSRGHRAVSRGPSRAADPRPRRPDARVAIRVPARSRRARGGGLRQAATNRDRTRSAATPTSATSVSTPRRSETWHSTSTISTRPTQVSGSGTCGAWPRVSGWPVAKTAWRRALTGSSPGWRPISTYSRVFLTTNSSARTQRLGDHVVNPVDQLLDA